MSIQLNSTICALATPPGIGAIGVIRLSGTDAITICNKVFKGRDLATASANTIHFGSIRDGERILDEVLVSVFKAPHSYTGENSVEISTHGSNYIQQQIIQLLIRMGAKAAGPGEYTQRAFLNGKLDLAEAEAVADMIASNSEASHGVAMQQMRGGFSEDIKTLRQELLDFASLIELELDFGEEDVEFADRTQLTNLVDKVLATTSSLITSFDKGNVIKNGIPVVIAGAPNTGKSTLLNALLNEDRAIVSEIAGTTRDTIEEELIIDGVVFRFIDTAGIRHTDDTIEAIGVKKALEKVKSSAVVLYMFDVHEHSVGDLKNIMAKLLEEVQGTKAKVIWVGNKIDHEDFEAIAHEFEQFHNLVLVSAREKQNLDTLIDKLVSEINLDITNLNQTIVTNTRHFEALSEANTALQKVKEGLESDITGDLLAMDIRQALHSLGSITGEVDVEELLGNIFGRVCIGK